MGIIAERLSARQLIADSKLGCICMYVCGYVCHVLGPGEGPRATRKRKASSFPGSVALPYAPFLLLFSYIPAAPARYTHNRAVRLWRGIQ